MTIAERFWKKVEAAYGGSCWQWLGTTNNVGYGWLYSPGGALLAHRISWEMFKGPVPVGLHVCHHCDNPGCVNPDHLFVGTDKDNAQDREKKGRSGWQNGNRRICR